MQVNLCPCGVGKVSGNMANFLYKITLFVSVFLLGIFSFVDNSYGLQTSSQAEGCAPVDVREGMNDHLQLMFFTPSNQGNIGWCFGYVANDLLSQKIGRPLSAIYTSAYYASRVSKIGRIYRRLQTGKTIMPEGGFVEGVVNELKALGSACTEKGAPSLGTVEGFLDRGLSTIGKTGDFFLLLHGFKEDNLTDLADGILDEMIRYYLKNLDIFEVKKRFKATDESQWPQLFVELLNSSCGDHRLKIPGELQVYTAKNEPQRKHKGMTLNRDKTKTITYKLDRLLESGRIVGVEYDASYVTDIISRIISPHASTVVARKMINNSCHYLVRNTWGERCSYFPGVICERLSGSYWVNRETLQKMSSKIIWIE